MNRLRFLRLSIAVLALLIGACGKEDSASPLSELQLPSANEALEIARKGYVFGFPMVMNYKTLHSYAIDTTGPEYKGPPNQVNCEARLFTPEDRAVVTPNADTPYCMFWLDLRAEPQVLSVPEMAEERFYHFQLIDLYTHNFAYVGTLTTGNVSGHFLIAGPDWDGQTPNGIDNILRSETNFVFSVTRTQLFGPDDLAQVEALQSQYAVTSLSDFLDTNPPSISPLPDFPEWVEGAQFDERFYSYLDLVMDLLETPAPGRESMWASLGRLGIGPGHDFDFVALPPELQDAIRSGREAGFRDMTAFIEAHGADPLISGKIFGTRDFLADSAGRHYQLEHADMLRAVAADRGLYGNSAAEAMYPTYYTDAAGSPLDASTNNYTLTFPAGQFPPVQAFWSLTMYDGRSQLFVPNPLDRYLLNSSMLDEFAFEADGSLVFHIGRDSPASGQDANWLPTPDGPFYLVLRLYGPEREVLEGDWTPPAVVAATQ